MAIKRPDSYEHENPKLPFVNAENVGKGYRDVSSFEERDAIPIAKRGRLVDVIGKALYRYTHLTSFADEYWTNPNNWVIVGENESCVKRTHSFYDLVIGYDYLEKPTLVNNGVVTPYVYADGSKLYRFESEDLETDAFYKNFENNSVNTFVISKKLTNTAPITQEINNLYIGNSNFRLIKFPGNTNTHLEINDLISEGFLDETIFIKKAKYINALGDGDITNFGTYENDYEDGNYTKVEIVKYN